MGNKISEVKQSYEKFAANSVIEQIQVFTETVKSLFFSSNDYDSENIAKMSIGNGDGDNDTFKAFKVAEDLVKLYQDAKKEERLLKECMELQKASEQTSLLLISRELCNN
ncbi:hypothetical protein H4219_003921 [Mycoemilia scoparia]|uniref:Uncharacterized protein n=1 Tax=Mycoemilia scoparia TaxID=417184 RepID=A0A9W7ZTD0_9FUNG|nr:hypothetical protein H4219_003921 [Mycoemilia scoparia]